MKAFQNGKGWSQLIGGNLYTLRPMTNVKGWYEIKINNRIKVQCGGKAYAVKEFNEILDSIRQPPCYNSK